MVTSERGKAVTKTANEFLIISIKDDNQETIGYIKIESQTDSIGDKIKVNYSFVDRVYVSEHKKTNENLKHDNNNVQDPSIGLMHYCNSECEHYKK